MLAVHLLLGLFVLTYVYVMSRHGAAIILTNVNNCLLGPLWLLVFAVCHVTRKVWPLAIPVVLLLLNEVMYVRYNRDVFNGDNRTKVCYDIGTQHFVRKHNGTENFTEAVYLDEWGQDMTLEQARAVDPRQGQQRRFKAIFGVLGLAHLSPHQYREITLLDLGCGNGEFVAYCRQRGIHATGMTISSEQAKYVQSKGIPCLEGNYKEFRPELAGTVDIITCMGTLEHLAAGIPCHCKTLKRQQQAWERVLDNCRKYFKPNSPYHLVYNTTLHLNRKYCSTVPMYLLERAYGGAYSFNTPGQRLADQAQGSGFRSIYARDMTYHYYLSSILDENHFGNPQGLTLERLLVTLPASIFINPQLLNLVLYGYYGAWMWQFDGQYHHEGGLPPTFETDADIRPVTLWWSVLKMDSRSGDEQ